MKFFKSRLGFWLVAAYGIFLAVFLVFYWTCAWEMCGILYQGLAAFPWIYLFDFAFEAIVGPPPYHGVYPFSTFFLLSIVLNIAVFYLIGYAIEKIKKRLSNVS